MTYNQLILKYPDIKFEVSNGQKRLARITVEYNVIGSPESILRFLDELDKEWPFAQQRCQDTTKTNNKNIQVEYLVKPGEIEDFVKAVPYRGKKIVLFS
jgi:hypothetical protein